MPAASYALLPKTKKDGLFLAIGEGKGSSVACPVTAVDHRSSSQHWPEGEAEPLMSAPRSEFMMRWWVGSIGVCRRLRITPPRIYVLFFSGRSWPKISQRNYFFQVAEKVQPSFLNICPCSDRYRNRSVGVFLVCFWGGEHHVSIVNGLIDNTCSSACNI